MEWRELVVYLRDINGVSMVLRFLLAAVCGGIIGLGRGRRQHPAGLRTHLLVCIGAASIMITSQFFIIKMEMPGDIVRMPTAVVSGIGFLGAGSILVTGKKHVTGLTTAAGLWATACMGLAAGAGYYECAALMCVLLYVALVALSKLDATHVKSSKVMNVYMELSPDVPLSQVLTGLKREGIQINSMDAFGHVPDAPGYLLELEILRSGVTHADALEKAGSLPGVAFFEEMKS